MDKPKVVLVTGASSGIGRYCAEFLARQGYRVYGTSRKAARADRFRMILMDVTQAASVRDGINDVIARESTIDVLVNNAGYALVGSLEDTTIEEARSQVETNFFGALRVCRAVLPTMRRQGSGYIVNISSIGGLIGLPFQSAYCASKFALEGAMESLRMEVGPFGIHVVLIEPGDFRTALTDRRLKAEAATRSTVYADKLTSVLNVIEAGERNGQTPEPIAALVHKVITMNAPRLRYTVGRMPQRMAVPLKKVLPSRAFQRVIATTFKAT